tara:strand:- start:11589 stop:11972 length:384 start_codon:yes stop_codon:yes gene_type:complete
MPEPMSAQERGALGAAKRWSKQSTDEPAASAIPKYRLTQICYHNDRIYDPDAQPLVDAADPESGLRPLYLNFTGHPAHYMEPANQAAHDMYDKYPPTPWKDPIASATQIVPSRQAAVDALAALVAAG